MCVCVCVCVCVCILSEIYICSMRNKYIYIYIYMCSIRNIYMCVCVCVCVCVSDAQNSVEYLIMPAEVPHVRRLDIYRRLKLEPCKIWAYSRSADVILLRPSSRVSTLFIEKLIKLKRHFIRSAICGSKCCHMQSVFCSGFDAQAG